MKIAEFLFFRARSTLMAGMLLACACSETSYVPYGMSTDADLSIERTVEFEVDAAFHRDPPRCVVVLPAVEPHPLDAIAADAFARHLTGRVPRVISPQERDRLARSMAIDLAEPAGRELLAHLIGGCRDFLVWRIEHASDDYAVIFSERRIRLSAAINRVPGDQHLWQAAHTASRWDGGMPLSILSIPLIAARAASFIGDLDQVPSMIDDAVRRMIMTLPDVRE